MHDRNFFEDALPLEKKGNKECESGTRDISLSITVSQAHNTFKLNYLS